LLILKNLDERLYFLKDKKEIKHRHQIDECGYDEAMENKALERAVGLTIVAKFPDCRFTPACIANDVRDVSRESCR